MVKVRVWVGVRVSSKKNGKDGKAEHVYACVCVCEHLEGTFKSFPGGRLPS